MTDNRENASADSTRTSSHLLAGAIELTPEARAILTKQVNRRIVWGYKVTKAVFYCLCCLPLLISAFFGYGFYNAGVDSIPAALLALVFVGGPMGISWFLSRLVAKF